MQPLDCKHLCVSFVSTHLALTKAYASGPQENGRNRAPTLHPAVACLTFYLGFNILFHFDCQPKDLLHYRYKGDRERFV